MLSIASARKCSIWFIIQSVLQFSCMNYHRTVLYSNKFNPLWSQSNGSKRCEICASYSLAEYSKIIYAVFERGKKKTIGRTKSMKNRKSSKEQCETGTQKNEDTFLCDFISSNQWFRHTELYIFTAVSHRIRFMGKKFRSPLIHFGRCLRFIQHESSVGATNLFSTFSKLGEPWETVEIEK